MPETTGTTAKVLPALDPGPLTDVVRAAVGDPAATVAELTRLSGGVSRETWSLDAVQADGGRQPLILQRRRPMAFDDGLDMETEAGVLRDDEFARARGLRAEQYGEALGRIHSMPVDAVPGLKPQDGLAYWEDVLDGIGHPHPALELGLRWLRANDPRAPGGDGGTSVCHGDFRNGNGIVGPDGLRAIIDWELTHLGDPMEDVGWFCIRAWRFGKTPPIGGFGTYEQFLDGYERVTGTRIDMDVLRWWQVWGSLRWSVICMNQGATHLTGHRRSVELVAVGRRATEAEFDMLLLMP
jgi:aminoglycoside phosphotransferase (APT) family kinase protein